jgi:hypothetical protein
MNLVFCSSFHFWMKSPTPSLGLSSPEAEHWLSVLLLRHISLYLFPGLHLYLDLSCSRNIGDFGSGDGGFTFPLSSMTTLCLFSPVGTALMLLPLTSHHLCVWPSHVRLCPLFSHTDSLWLNSSASRRPTSRPRAFRSRIRTSPRACILAGWG